MQKVVKLSPSCDHKAWMDTDEAQGRGVIGPWCMAEVVEERVIQESFKSVLVQQENSTMEEENYSN